MLPETRCVHEQVFTLPEDFDRMIEGLPFKDAVSIAISTSLLENELMTILEGREPRISAVIEKVRSGH